MAVQVKSSLFAPPLTAPEGQIHFVASTNFSNVNFFQNITNANSSYDFSNLEVYINGELTNQVANSISASADDDVIIRATDDHYPWFGSTSAGGMDYIKSMEEPFPLMHQANGNPITSLSFCFGACYSLTSIPQGLFDNNPNVTDFWCCFYGCSNLTSIPQGLFDNNPNVTDFWYCFYGCSNLTSIPQGLFDNNPQATNFDSCFYNCSSLTSIPQGLFDNNPQATDFDSCFCGCSNLTSIPQGLFDNNPQVTGFYGCFSACSSLTSIPQGLFDKNTLVTSFSCCFEGCSSLTSIPQGLFDKNTQVTSFSFCFSYCSNLTVNVQIGSTASPVYVAYFARATKSKGTVYCRAGSAAYGAFTGTGTTNVNVLTY